MALARAPVEMPTGLSPGQDPERLVQLAPGDTGDTGETANDQTASSATDTGTHTLLHGNGLQSAEASAGYGTGVQVPKAQRFSWIIAAALLSTPGTAYAQGSAFGLRGGFGPASVSSTEFAFSEGSVTAFQIGAFMSVFTPTLLTLQPEVQYSRRGFSAFVIGGEANANLSYVEVPLLFKLGLNDETNRLRPSAILGTFIGFEVGCSLSGGLEGLGGDPSCDSILAGRGKMDAGVILGAGADYGLTGRWFLTGDIRYSLGLLNVAWEEELDRVTSRTWSFMAGAGVFLGR